MLKLLFFRGPFWQFGSVAVLCILFSSSIGLFLGQDLNWDAINYHFYLPHLALDGRFDQDFFAAGKQSYLNPLLYFPFYFMVNSGVSPVVIVFVLSALQSFTFFILFLLIWALLKGKVSFSSLVLICLVSSCSPVALQLLGSTFSDLFIAGFQLLSLFYLVLASRGNYWKNLFLSGFFMGAAAGFKYVYAIYCLPLGGAVLLMFFRQGKNLFKALLACVLGGVVGFLSADGWWAYKLYIEFGSPTFPYFNGVFSSDFYFDVSYPIDRFRKDDIFEILSFPFRVALPEPYYYSEVISPDVRLIVSFIFIVVSICVVVFFRGKFKFTPVALSLLTFFVSSFFIWAWISGNGRYAIILLFIAPVVSMLAVYRIFSERVHRICWGVVLVVQFCVIVIAGVPRWSPIEWADEWYPYEVPVELTLKPALFLSGEVISFSFLAGKVHSDSSFVTARGQVPFPDLPVTIERLEKLIQSVEGGDIWGLSYYPLDEGASPAYTGSLSNEKVFSRLGFSLINECYEIEPYYSQVGMAPVAIAACKLKYDPDLLMSSRYQRFEIERRFEKVARLCKDLFFPSVIPPIQFGSQWEAMYPGTENILILTDGVFVAKPKRGNYLIKLINFSNVDALDSCPVETFDVGEDEIRR